MLVVHRPAARRSTSKKSWKSARVGEPVKPEVDCFAGITSVSSKMPKRTSAKKNKLAEDKEELLISHVKQYPVLYTIKHERYYDTKLKSGIWQTIAGILEEESK